MRRGAAALGEKVVVRSVRMRMLACAHVPGPFPTPPGMTDRRILYAAAFVRALATGMIGVLMGVFLAHLDFDPSRIGYVVGAGLSGCAAAALLVTLVGERVGRRRSLLFLSLLGACGGLGFALTAHPFAAGATAFLGVVDGMGRDRGASLILDQALLPAPAADRRTTQAFAWYNVPQTIAP